MIYTINGKEYSEFDINKRCAEIEGFKCIKSHPNAKIINSVKNSIVTEYGKKDYCTNPSDTWPIIEKCWNELMNPFGAKRWGLLMQKHDCSKLIAACICFIEMKE